MRTKMMFATIVVALAALTLAGWGCGGSYGVPYGGPPDTADSADAVDTGAEIPADAAVDTSDWQIYSDPTYGVEFKYPQGWMYWENREGTEALRSLSFDAEDAEYTSSIDFAISSSVSTLEEDVEAFAEEDLDILEQGTVTINDIQWRRLVTKQRETPLQFIFYSAGRDGKSYAFSSDYAGDGVDGGLNQRNIDALQGILDSFRFAE